MITTHRRRKTNAPSSSPNVTALLSSANNASEKVSGLHIGFMAVCAYNLVVAFSTTDMDLLVGKGIRLPVVDVEVSIVAFYVIVPYVILLMHFNLLLQLQMLSRKLYAYDASVAPSKAISVENDAATVSKNPVSTSKLPASLALADGLNVFPYSYYLVGWTSQWMHRCLGTVVGITILLLPLFTLLILQLRFLAYQNHWYTWSQRIAVIADVVIVIYLWPKIMSREDSWSDYWKRLKRDIWICKVPTFICAALWVAWCYRLFARDAAVNDQLVLFFKNHEGLAKLVRGYVSETPDVPLLFTFFLVVISLLGIIVFFEWRNRYCKCNEIQGILPYLLVIMIGILMPLALVAKGEGFEKWWGETNFSESPRVIRFRTLNLTGQVIFTKSVPPETVENLRRGGINTKQALSKVAPIDLKSRGLRGAKLTNSVLTKADLANANLTGADLYAAHLEYANLDGSILEGVSGEQAYLDGAIFSKAKLKDACFYQADLQGAFLKESEANSADFDSANLMGTDLTESVLTDANFRSAKLQGANFFHAKLVNANFKLANLHATDVTMKAEPEPAPENLSLASISACQKQKEKASKRFTLRTNEIPDQKPKDMYIKTIGVIIKESCSAQAYSNISNGAPIIVDCGRPLGSSESAFKERLYHDMRKYACESPAIATALLLQGYNEGSRRINFLGAMNDKDNSWPCKIMDSLSPEDSRKIRLKWEEIENSFITEKHVQG
jgi:uncharacterized protein YjbI with pentapeptide repeats